MNLRPRQREEPEVSLTPLIDIVFLLLIFFMVSTTFRKESEFKIELPQASQRPTSVERQQLEVAIDIDGNYAVNDVPLPDKTLATLVAFLNDAAGDDFDQPMLIRADGKAAHQAVITAMDAAGKLGFRRLGIVTVHRAERDGS